MDSPMVFSFRKSGFSVLIVFFAALLVSCGVFSSGRISEDDRLTPEEKDLFINAARDYLLNSGIRDKFSESEKLYIKNKDPESSFSYTGHKEGKFRLSWRVSDRMEVWIKGGGPFLESSCKMIISIIT